MNATTYCAINIDSINKININGIEHSINMTGPNFKDYFNNNYLAGGRIIKYQFNNINNIDTTKKYYRLKYFQNENNDENKAKNNIIGGGRKDNEIDEDERGGNDDERGGVTTGVTTEVATEDNATEDNATGDNTTEETPKNSSSTNEQNKFIEKIFENFKTIIDNQQKQMSTPPQQTNPPVTVVYGPSNIPNGELFSTILSGHKKTPEEIEQETNKKKEKEDEDKDKTVIPPPL